MNLPAIIAHRGASHVELENTLASFRKAVELGADGIELDVHGTADGVLLVHHDPDIGGRAIADHTADELRERPLKNGEPVPTLAEALNAIGTNLDVYIEVKALAEHLDATLLATMDAGPAPAHYHVHGFDHRLIRRLTTERPALSAGVLSASYPLDPVAPARAAGARTLWQVQDLIDVPLVAQIHDAGMQVIAWTVDRPFDARRLAALGVDGLCTNEPDRIRETLT